MHIHHVAVWTADLERLRAFYVDVLGGTAGSRYENPAKGFASYFVSFGEGGARIELMTRAGLGVLPADDASADTRTGWVHVAFRVGSTQAVDALVARLRAAGVPVVGEARTTGDGYYEAVVTDPDGNRIEIVA